MPGFVNCDLADNWCKTKPDVVCDVFQTLPFPDDYADEVHGYHIFEHVQRYDSDAVLKDWTRVLKPGGLMVLELPCLDRILNIFNYFLNKDEAPPAHLTLWGLFGDPKWHNPAMMHHWCYSIDELRSMMEAQGMSVKSTKPKTHQPLRDMRLEGIKCTK